MIWCVEDDAGIREIELYTLRSMGYEVRGFADGTAMQEALSGELPELILLDVMLPGVDGVTLLRQLKSASITRDIPIIMATAKGMEYDKIESLDLGADDYLVKPFGMMEMVARVKAVLRRCIPQTAPKIIQLDGLSLSTDQRTVEVDGIPAHLTYKEFEILRLFLIHPGHVYTREQLFSTVWGEGYVGETRTVDMHIRTLRQKLGLYGDRILTVRGVGYKMEATKA